MAKTNTCPTIAEAITCYVMTDGSIRVAEHFPLLMPHSVQFTSFEQPEDALDYLRETDALSIDSKWFGTGEGSAIVEWHVMQEQA